MGTRNSLRPSRCRPPVQERWRPLRSPLPRGPKGSRFGAPSLGPQAARPHAAPFLARALSGQLDLEHLMCSDLLADDDVVSHVMTGLMVFSRQPQREALQFGLRLRTARIAASPAVHPKERIPRSLGTASSSIRSRAGGRPENQRDQAGGPPPARSCESMVSLTRCCRKLSCS